MADLTRNELGSTSGVVETLVAAASGGDTLINDDRTFLVVNNGGAGSINVTITAQVTTVYKEGFGNISVGNLVVAVGAGERRIITAPPRIYNNSAQKISITYSAVTSVTVGGFRRPAD